MFLQAEMLREVIYVASEYGIPSSIDNPNAPLHPRIGAGVTPEQLIDLTDSDRDRAGHVRPWPN